MGSAESHHDHFDVRNGSYTNFHKRLSKRHSCPSGYAHSNEGFYPPPVLHTLHPRLRRYTVFDKQEGFDISAESTEKLRAETMVVDMVLKKPSVHSNLTAQISSASSISSGCSEESSDPDISLSPLPSVQKNRGQRRSVTKHSTPRLSVDSGTGLDEEETLPFDPLGSADQVDRQIGNPSTLTFGKVPSDDTTVYNEQMMGERTGKRRRKKLSLKSLKSLRTRALSLPSSHFGEKRKNSKHLFLFLFSLFSSVHLFCSGRLRRFKSS